MNARRGSARTFARTVRDVIGWHGQRRTLFQSVTRLRSLPPIAVFWGDRDPVIPFAHAKVLDRLAGGVRVTRFAREQAIRKSP